MQDICRASIGGLEVAGIAYKRIGIEELVRNLVGHSVPFCQVSMKYSYCEACFKTMLLYVVDCLVTRRSHPLPETRKILVVIGDLEEHSLYQRLFQNKFFLMGIVIFSYVSSLTICSPLSSI